MTTDTAATVPLEASAPDARKLAARVACRRVEAAMRENPTERVLFSIVGLTQEQVSAIATEIDCKVAAANVHIHPQLSDGTLPDRLLSDKTSTYWRNASKPDGVGAVVFAVPDEERETTGASIANIVTLDTTTLIEDARAWIEESRIALNDSEKMRIEESLAGLRQTDLIRDLSFFARFVARVCAAIQETPTAAAIDRSLPELRLPLEAGRFKERHSKSYNRAKWKTEFERIDADTRDKLYLRDVRGAPLNRNNLRERVDTLEAEDKVSHKVAAAARDLLADETIAAGKWQDSQSRLVEFPWSEVEKIFADTKAKQEKTPLGQETLDFFAYRYPESLTDEQSQTLKDLDEQTAGSTSDEREFFYTHRETLRGGNRRLYNRWERYIFRKSTRAC